MASWWRPAWRRTLDTWKRGMPAWSAPAPLQALRASEAQTQAHSVPLYSFAKPEDIEAWTILSDQMYKGGSTGSLELTNDGTALFKGSLSLRTEGTPMKQSGFVSMLPRDRETVKDLGECDALQMRVKTDGRIYIASIKTNTVVRDHLYQTFFSTPPGTWLDVLLPFSEFHLTWRGQVEGEAVALDPSLFQAVSILMAERKEGPFQLELAWIRAVHSYALLGRRRRYSGRHADYLLGERVDDPED
jgi:NADH dehydrogenase [ubiquinone] 1 alpha subcomplex assembly factor 1